MLPCSSAQALRILKTVRGDLAAAEVLLHKEAVAEISAATGADVLEADAAFYREILDFILTHGAAENQLVIYGNL